MVQAGGWLTVCTVEERESAGRGDDAGEEEMMHQYADVLMAGGRSEGGSEDAPDGAPPRCAEGVGGTAGS